MYTVVRRRQLSAVVVTVTIDAFKIRICCAGAVDRKKAFLLKVF